MRDAIIDATAALAAEQGLASLTMSGIAAETGLGRATLYKYFHDVEAILVAWHERHVEHYLARLTTVRDRSTDPYRRLEDVLEAYATISHERTHEHHGRARVHDARVAHPNATSHAAHHAGAGAPLAHRTEHVDDVQRRLEKFLAELITAAAKNGAVRKDVPPVELAQYCLRSLGPTGERRTLPAARRLVRVTLAGLRPPRR